MKVMNQMEPKVLREMAYNSVKPEIEKLESEMVAAAKKGELKIYTPTLSQAAREYFNNKGYKCKMCIGNGNEHKDQWTIEW